MTPTRPVWLLLRGGRPVPSDSPGVKAEDITHWAEEGGQWNPGHTWKGRAVAGKAKKARGGDANHDLLKSA